MSQDCGDETTQFEGVLKHTTRKFVNGVDKGAYLVEPASGPTEVWLPKSQTVEMAGPDENGNHIFTVTLWWARKNGI